MSIRHEDPTAWMMVAREAKAYLCGDAEGPRTCNHRSPRAACRCRKGTHLYARLENKQVIRVSVEHLAASNGEQAWLPFPTTKEDYDTCFK